jgi:site-specific DNA-methyltransferase (cytosine-N4-specific)
MLTDEEDVVLDIFGGSNTTGFTAQALKRKWLTFEINMDYLASSTLRFLEGHSPGAVKQVLKEMNNCHADYFIGETVCSLDPTKKAKSKNDSQYQGALFVSEVGAAQ